MLIELVVLDELNRRWPPLVHLLLLVQEAGGWEDDAAEIALGIRQSVGDGECWPPIVLCDEGAVQMT